MARNSIEAHEMLNASRYHPDLISQIVPAPHTLEFDTTIKKLLADDFIGDLITLDGRVSFGCRKKRILHPSLHVTLSGQAGAPKKCGLKSGSHLCPCERPHWRPRPRPRRPLPRPRLLPPPRFEGYVEGEGLKAKRCLAVAATGFCAGFLLELAGGVDFCVEGFGLVGSEDLVSGFWLGFAAPLSAWRRARCLYVCSARAGVFWTVRSRRRVAATSS